MAGMIRTNVDPSKVRGVYVSVACENCNETGRVEPELVGNRRYEKGELTDCPLCNGRGTTMGLIPEAQLYDVLMGNIRRRAD